MAFRDRAGRIGATTRQSVFLAGVMVIAAVSLATWIGGLHHVDTDEAAHGWLWDAAIGNVHFDMRNETVVELQRDPRIAASTRYVTGQAVLDGKSTAVSSFDPAGTPPRNCYADACRPAPGRSPWVEHSLVGVTWGSATPCSCLSPDWTTTRTARRTPLSSSASSGSSCCRPSARMTSATMP